MVVNCWYVLYLDAQLKGPHLSFQIINKKKHHFHGNSVNFKTLNDTCCDGKEQNMLSVFSSK